MTLSPRPRRARLLSGLALAALLATAAPAALAPASAQELALTAESRRTLTLTVYNQNLGLVSETRQVELPAGESLLAIEDVSGQMQPESVLLSGQGLRVIEQSLAADLLTPQRLLEASVGDTVQIIRSNPTTGAERVEEARVLSLAGGLVVQMGDRIEVLPLDQGFDPLTRIAFTDMPQGLRSEPALLALVFPGQVGANDLRLDYLTGGLSWRADYVARLNPAGDRLDLSALVTLSNTTDTDFEGATLRLVAGEVNQGPRVIKRQEQFMAMAGRAEMAPAADVSEAVPAADRYVYSLGRPVTLRRGETKQIPLMSARGVTAVREYRFEGLVNGHPRGGEEIGPVNAALILELENSGDLGLGAPLPAGTVRVYGPSESGEDATLFLGADAIAHTPEGEKARLTLGQAFDVTARAERTVYDQLSQRSYETGQKVTLQNAKDEAVEVVVAGEMPRGWTLREQSAEPERVTASRVEWRLTVPAGGETELTYRIRVTN